MQVTDNYAAVLEQARHEFAQRDSMEIAGTSGAAFSFYPPRSWREFLVPFMGRAYRVIWPTGEVTLYPDNTEVSTGISLVLLHYLSVASGKPPEGKWLPFSQLWGGSSYNQAFKKWALDPLVEFYGNKGALFQKIVTKRLHAQPGKQPRTFVFMALPRLPMQIRLEEGDEEIPAQASLLFDAVANDYLVTEDLAALGEYLARRLVKWGREELKS